MGLGEGSVELSVISVVGGVETFLAVSEGM
jgi:hypothetical protein